MSFWYSRFFSQDLESDLEALIGIAPDLDGQGFSIGVGYTAEAVFWFRVKGYLDSQTSSKFQVQ